MYSISASFQRALTNRRNFLIYLIRLVSLFETNFKWIYIYSAIVRRVRYDHVFYIVPLVLNIEVIDNRVSRLNCRKVGRREGRDGGGKGGGDIYTYRFIGITHRVSRTFVSFHNGNRMERERSTKRRNEASTWLEGLTRRFTRRPFRVFITKRIEKLIFIYLEASQVIVHQESCTGKTL